METWKCVASSAQGSWPYVSVFDALTRSAWTIQPKAFVRFTADFQRFAAKIGNYQDSKNILIRLLVKPPRKIPIWKDHNYWKANSLQPYPWLCEVIVQATALSLNTFSLTEETIVIGHVRQLTERDFCFDIFQRTKRWLNLSHYVHAFVRRRPQG